MGHERMNQASKYKVPEEELTTYLVEDRRARLSPWGRSVQEFTPTRNYLAKRWEIVLAQQTGVKLFVMQRKC